MKRSFLTLVFCFFALPISAGINTRVARVVDSRTIVLEGGSVVTLRGVDVPPADEQAAAEYLRFLIGRAPVFVDPNGDVYRSPDALFVNGELMMRAWEHSHRERYLGESMPPARAQRAPAPPPAKKAARIEPPRRPRYRSKRTR